MTCRQKHVKSMSVPWWQTVKNGHIITCVFTLLASNEDKKILYTQAKSININLLQEEPEMQEVKLQIGGKHLGKHEGYCKKPGETSKAG